MEYNPVTTQPTGNELDNKPGNEPGEQQNGAALPTSATETALEAALFAPAGLDFQPVSENWIKLRLTTLLISQAVQILILVGGLILLSDTWPANWLWAVGITLGVVWLVVLIWQLWLIPRQVRAWSYAEGPSDLVVRHGIMFRRLMAVPYGRMQFVDVKQGPLQRFFGIASVTLNTASPETNAVIHGLSQDQATRLRQRLTERGEALRAGL